MSYDPIDTTAPGDTPKVAGDKVNAGFAELYPEVATALTNAATAVTTANSAQSSVTTLSSSVAANTAGIATLTTGLAATNVNVTNLQTAVSGLGIGSQILYASAYPGMPTNMSDCFTPLQAAINAAATAGKALIIDLPLYVQQGTNWLKTLFVGANTAIWATDAGSITYDGVGVPLIIAANAANSTIRGLKMIYTGTFGVTAYTANPGAVVTFGALTGGSGYTNGTYQNVRLTGGAGIDCYVTITVAGGIVTSCVLQGALWGGSGYVATNSLTTANTYLGGAGSGFSILVATVTSGSNAFSQAYNNSTNITMNAYYTGAYVAGVSGNQFTGGAQPFFSGATNACATVQVRGASTGFAMIDCKIVVPANAPACNFVPTAMMFTRDWTPGLIISGSSAINTLGTLVGGSGYSTAGVYTGIPLTGGAGTQATATITVAGGAVTAVSIQQSGSGYVVGNTLSAADANIGGRSGGAAFTIQVATKGSSLQTVDNMSIPTDCEFRNLVLDGVYMGFVGSAVNPRWTNTRSKRYSDMQNSIANDPLGNMVGGVGYWFAPPHLFYLASDAVFNTNAIVKQTLDEGGYVGVTVRRSSSSGVINSCKIPPQNGTVIDGYDCSRVEGWGQVTTSGVPNGRIENISSIYNSTTYMLTKPGDSAVGGSAIIFPSSNPLNSVFIRGNFTDVAPVPAGFPIGSDATSTHAETNLDVKVVTQDYPAAAYSVVDSSGHTVSSGYNTGYPGFGFGGTGNFIKAEVTFVAFTNTASTFRGVIANQSGASNFSTWDIKIVGWGQFTGSTIDSRRPRILIAGAGAGTNTNIVRQVDVANQMVTEIKGAKMSETWVQDGVFTPAPGASYDLPGVIFPNTFSATDTVYLNGATAPAGPTSMTLGDAALSTRLLSGMSVTANANPYQPRVNPIPLVTASTQVRLSAVGGNFTGTGTIYVAIEGQRSSVAG